jgi:uncharacterized membrane protein
MRVDWAGLFARSSPMEEPNPIPTSAHRSRFYHRLDPRRASLRVLLGVGVGLVGALLARGHAWPFRLLLGWDAGALALLSFMWLSVLARDPHETRCRAAAADPGRTATWVLVLIMSAFSLFAGAFVLRNLHNTRLAPEPWLLPLCLLSVMLAWNLTHTSYTLRYAHLFYRDDQEGEGGLVFPGDRQPDDFDFAYFAYTVGMCFQVSDVAVSSPQIRRAVLGHAVLSFLYNTVILALALNLFFGSVAG